MVTGAGGVVVVVVVVRTIDEEDCAVVVVVIAALDEPLLPAGVSPVLSLLVLSWPCWLGIKPSALFLL